MKTEDYRRKLSAVFSADVKGYSRLMGQDELTTIRTLNAYREVMTDLIQTHRGRVVDATGDNLLAEFASVVDAVDCAVEVQRKLAERNQEIPDDRKMHFRIGINLGDVVEEEGRIYGDGVNIAARVESLAEAGGVCISGTAYDQVENKLNVEFEYLGEHTVKNISKPVRVYRVLSVPGASAHRVVKAKIAVEKIWRKYALISVAIIFVGLVAILIFYASPRPASPEREASAQTAPLAFSSKPSIAVLPFVNMSKDPEQEFFADGMTEDLITDLSKFPDLAVLARNSAFQYKGKMVKPEQVGQELGVRYVMEGSVRKSDDKVRINAQLVDATNGMHLWAERYDRELEDIFAVQDEIARKIVTALRHRVLGQDIVQFVRSGGQ
jgi:TolB-like protein/class 3 adenylate cyclase